MNSKKTVVAIFIRGFHNGGIEKVFETYLSNMSLSQFEIHVVTHLKNDEKRKMLFSNMGCFIHELSFIKGHSITLQNIKEYKCLFDKNKFDVVHNNMPDYLLPLYMARKKNVPKRILHAHNNYTDGYNLFQKILSPLYKLGFSLNASFATDLIAINDSSGYSVFRNRNFFILPNAIDIDRFRYNGEARKFYRRKLQIEENEILIGNIGRMESDVKNQLFSLELFEKICGVSNRFKLVLVGDGVRRCIYEQKARQSRNSSKIIFTGNVQNVFDYLMAMDMFIFPSKKEGLGIVAIEAQATGLQCICSNHVPKDVKVTDNVVFSEIDSPDSIENWKELILNLINKENAPRELFAEKVSEAGYDIKKCSRILESIYIK